MVSSVIFVISYACPRGLRAALYPFRPLAKVVADLTLKRSSKTKHVTIQPPPQTSIFKCWSVALVSHKSSQSHKTSETFLRDAMIGLQVAGDTSDPRAVLNWPRNTLREDPARDSITLATPTQMYPVLGYLWRRRS
jgi:hypothetical protein